MADTKRIGYRTITLEYEGAEDLDYEVETGIFVELIGRGLHFGYSFQHSTLDASRYQPREETEAFKVLTIDGSEVQTATHTNILDQIAEILEAADFELDWVFENERLVVKQSDGSHGYGEYKASFVEWGLVLNDDSYSASQRLELENGCVVKVAYIDLTKRIARIEAWGDKDNLKAPETQKVITAIVGVIQECVGAYWGTPVIDCNAVFKATREESCDVSFLEEIDFSAHNN
jgi:hypothetical protein